MTLFSIDSLRFGYFHSFYTGVANQVGLWAAVLLFPVIWATICQKLRENGQNFDNSLNSESNLGIQKKFLGSTLDTLDITYNSDKTFWNQAYFTCFLNAQK